MALDPLIEKSKPSGELLEATVLARRQSLIRHYSGRFAEKARRQR